MTKYEKLVIPITTIFKEDSLRATQFDIPLSINIHVVRTPLK